MKRFLKFCIWLLVLAGIGGAGYYYWQKKEQTKSAQHSSSTSAEIVVEVAPAQKLFWNHELRVVGTVASKGNATIGAEVAGRVTEIAIRSGERVKRGQLLFRINDADAKAALKQAQAALTNSYKDYLRKKLILAKGAVSHSDFDTATQQYESSQADVAQKKAQLALTAIRAPSSGVIGLKKVNVGDYVNSGDELINFKSDRTSRVDFSIPSQYVHDLHHGLAVAFFTESHPTKLLKATISAIDSHVDVDTRNIGVQANVLAEGVPLAAGAYVEVVLHVGPKKPVIVVPETALRYALGGASVFIVANKVAHEVPVKLIERRAAGAVIEGELKAGDLVVTRGVMKLHDGANVETC